MKGQGIEVTRPRNGDQESTNNNSDRADTLHMDKSATDDLSNVEDGKDMEDNEEIVNASLVVNISENHSHLNSLNSFSFHRDLNQNQSTSTVSSSEEDSSLSIESPLASSRSAPPDYRDYSTKAECAARDCGNNKVDDGNTDNIPRARGSLLLNNETPAFTSTPKQNQVEINGSTRKSDEVAADDEPPPKTKVSVTFADIVKRNEEKNFDASCVPESSEEDSDSEDLTGSIYYSMAYDHTSSSKRESVGDSKDLDNRNASGKNANSLNFSELSMSERSELDLASVSAVHGSEESSDTLVNVSNWNATVNDSAVLPATPPSNQNINPLASRDYGAGDHLDLYPSGNVDDEAADEEVHKINANLFLPTTVTELTATNGVKVYVVGTAHFSEQSQHDVAETIRKLRPTLVVLELCHSRRNILTLDEETILRESADMSLGKVKEAINQSGAVQGTLHLLLLSMSAQLTKKLGMAPGGEFRAAVREARNVPGCLLLLGDRPFKVTLSRAISALSFGQKLKLAWQFLTSNDDITKDEIERCKEKDLLERMMMEMTGEFPAISRVFVSERDSYLAHSLWLAATSTSHKNQGGPIVGVFGMGHVSGIVQNWGKTTEEQIANLMIIPEPSVTTIIVRSAIKYSFYALLGYGVYRCSRRLFDFPPNGIVRSTWDRIPDLKTKYLGSSRG